MRWLRRLKAAYLLAMTLALGGLAAEVWCRRAFRAKVFAAEAFRRQHTNAFDGRQTIDVWAESVWLKRWDSYKPNAHLELRLGGHQIRVDINGLGFRTREFSPKKARGLIRVLCIGGSTTVQGLTNDTTYPAVLERRLQDHHPELDIEVLNLGISGIASAYWPERGFPFLDFQPDIVVQYEGVNDLLNVHLPRWAAHHPLERWLRASLVVQRLHPLPGDALDQGIASTIRNIAAVSSACRSRGVQHVVGTFASPEASRASAEMRAFLDVNLQQDWTSGPLALSQYSTYERLLARLNRAIAQAAAPSGYRVAPVADRLRAPEDFVDICHMTPDGIAALAEAFLPEVDLALASVAARARGSELAQESPQGEVATR